MNKGGTVVNVYNFQYFLNQIYQHVRQKNWVTPFPIYKHVFSKFLEGVSGLRCIYSLERVFMS